MLPSILIVEDEETVGELLAFAFRRAGFDVKLLRDGRAAAEHVESSPAPHAVILDVMLPCRDGYTVAAAMRRDARWRDVPIVMLSAAPEARHAHLANHRVDVDAYVEKPFRPTALVEAVRKLVPQANAA